MTRYVVFPVALIASLFLCAVGARAQVNDPSQNDHSQTENEINRLRSLVTETRSPKLILRTPEPSQLKPSRVDRERYAEFLSHSNTGLIRLLPRDKNDNNLPIRGSGAFYSFARLTHAYGFGSDISLEQGEFFVGFAGADFGFMLNLGDVPVETVSKETEGVGFMLSYETPSAERDARAAYREFADREGRREGLWTYKNRLPVVLDNTYALRSINYDDSDILVVFRVVRVEDDGSVVLLWKRLKKFRTPLLERSRASAAP